jgi:hypothetical protein
MFRWYNSHNIYQYKRSQASSKFYTWFLLGNTCLFSHTWGIKHFTALPSLYIYWTYRDFLNDVLVCSHIRPKQYNYGSVRPSNCPRPHKRYLDTAYCL